jgi:hypothetical protein
VRRGALPTFLAATVLGAAGGWLLARTHDWTQRRDLFARHPWQRFAALGWIERAGDPAAIAVLQDYVEWEPMPRLRLRAHRVIAGLRRGLG